MERTAPQQSHDRLATHGLHAVTEYLEGEGVAFEIIEHPPTDTASAESRAAHVPSAEMAKTVVVHDGPTWILAVVPASHRLDLEKLRLALGAGEPLKLATEEELAERFPAVEVGALPPVGPVLVGATVVDGRLLTPSRIACAGGDHRHALRLDPRDVIRLADAHVADICRE
jgi:Ala-tRNA(Pro) deacylase